MKMRQAEAVIFRNSTGRSEAEIKKERYTSLNQVSTLRLVHTCAYALLAE